MRIVVDGVEYEIEYTARMREGACPFPYEEPTGFHITSLVRVDSGWEFSQDRARKWLKRNEMAVLLAMQEDHVKQWRNNLLKEVKP